MVVKSKRGRRRYIAFSVPSGIRRDEFVADLAQAPDIPEHKVITCGDGRAVVRCGPSDVDRTIAAVQAAFPGSESLLTSGTLRTLREKHPELIVKGRKKHRKHCPHISLY